MVSLPPLFLDLLAAGLVACFASCCRLGCGEVGVSLSLSSATHGSSPRDPLGLAAAPLPQPAPRVAPCCTPCAKLAAFAP